ncbi:unnamed protein product [Phyllotreta striolata]|uniref:FLYWCH-type domain-containing protein n=1 Tax=Phyllotreta striolata TaxID=444603 RepID=A0A9N9XRG7_PHYSR|nr:unnamed protein product [Phyllotreta striolata]
MSPYLLTTGMCTQRGKPKFSHDGYIYVFDKLSQNRLTTFYRCEQKTRCKARIHVQNGQVIKLLNGHTHDPAKFTKINGDYIRLID